MAVEKFWEMEEVDSIRNWLHDLNKIGYKEPKIVNFDIVDKKCNESKIDSSPNGFFQVRYTPKFQKSIDTDNYCCDGRIEEIYDNYESIKYLDNFCSMSNASLSYNLNSIDKTSNYSKIILLITFNTAPYPQNIDFIRHVYGGYFKNIIFCGKNIINILNQTKYSFKKFDSYTFIDVDVGWEGTSHYFCMTKAIEMKFSTEGILLMSDDVLLKYWNLDKYDLKKIWYPFKLECKQELTLNSTSPGWAHWNTYNLDKLIRILKQLNEIINKPELVENEHFEMAKNYMETMSFNSITSSENSKTTKVCSCFGSDIFFLPKSYLPKFHYISNIFRSYDLHLEIALPTILSGMEKNTLFDLLKGEFIWTIKFFDFTWHSYDKVLDFVHPSKISKYNASINGRLFCQKFVQEHITHISS